jgi:hypothetical protein
MYEDPSLSSFSGACARFEDFGFVVVVDVSYA